MKAPRRRRRNRHWIISNFHMRLDDCETNRKSKTKAVIFGRVKWFKKRLFFRRNIPGPRSFTNTSIVPAFCHSGGDLEYPLDGGRIRHCIHCIHREVEQHLLQLDRSPYVVGSSGACSTFTLIARLINSLLSRASVELTSLLTSQRLRCPLALLQKATQTKNDLTRSSVLIDNVLKCIVDLPQGREICSSADAALPEHSTDRCERLVDFMCDRA